MSSDSDSDCDFSDSTRTRKRTRSKNVKLIIRNLGKISNLDFLYL